MAEFCERHITIMQKLVKFSSQYKKFELMLTRCAKT